MKGGKISNYMVWLHLYERWKMKGGKKLKYFFLSLLIVQIPSFQGAKAKNDEFQADVFVFQYG
jgi:hypothetical protein